MLFPKMPMAKRIRKGRKIAKGQGHTMKRGRMDRGGPLHYYEAFCGKCRAILYVPNTPVKTLMMGGAVDCKCGEGEIA
jgi:hypothetical protein